MRASCWGLLVCLSFLLWSCTKPNPVVCCTDPNDCASIGLNTENERPCEGDLRCVDNICTEVTTCLNDNDCGGGTPFCASGLCVECLADLDCSAEAPRCSEEHSCVECLQSDDCPMGSPVCELGTQTCRGCQADEECASTVCDFELGTCVDESTVIYADPQGPTSTVCSKANPCSITSAFSVANVAREIIKLNPGTYTANIVVANKKVTVHGDGATLTTDAGDTLVAQDRALLRVLGLVIVNNATDTAGVGFECVTGVDKPVVVFDRVTVDTNKIAITAGCNLTLSRSHVHVRTGSVAVAAGDASVININETLIDGQQGNGVEAFQNSVVRIVNSVIVGQTGSEGALLGVNGGAVFVSYSTIVDSLIECSTGTAVCSGNTPSGVCIDNSIVRNTLANAPANTVTETNCRFDFTLVSPQVTAVTGANNMLGVDPLFIDPTNGDYHLQASSPAVDTADPGAVNPIDYDGNLRPQGAANDLGAFERQ